MPFGVLPVWPVGFSVLLLALGLTSLGQLRRYSAVLVGTGVFVLLGTLSQLLTPPLEQPKLPPWPAPPASANLMSPNIVSRLVGFNFEDKQVLKLVRREGDFWQMPRVNPQTKRPFIEVHLLELFPVQVGTTYTQSIYFRHDGSWASFQFSFFTANGHHLVPTRVVEVGGGLKRAYATYLVQAGDNFVRGLDLVGLQGDWSYLDLAFPQLEPSPKPSAYRLPGLAPQPLAHRVAWFWSTALLGMLALSGGLTLLPQRALAPALLTLGLAGILCIVVWQLLSSPLGFGSRASGLVSHPNLLGHLAVVVVGLILVLADRRWVLAGLLLALALIWFSGSRGAIIGLAPLVAFWLGSLGALWRRVALGAICVLLLLAIWLGTNNDLGRFSTVFDSSYYSTASRMAIWRSASSVIRDYPWAGVGWGNFPHYYALRGAEGAIENTLSHAHNLALQFLTESGVLGLSGLAGLLGGIAITLGRTRAWAGLVLLVSVLLLNLFDYSFFNVVVYYPLWLAVACGSAQARNHKSFV